MTEITAAILATTEEEFDRKIARVAALGIPVQIDVIDGIFVPNKTWITAEEAHKRLKGLVFDVHLMVSNPEHAVPLWLATGARRVFFHEESTKVERLIVKSMPESASRLGVAINPETPVSAATATLRDVPNVLIMGVKPGWSGQAFQPIAIDKIQAIKGMNPSIHVTIDGGVTPENAPQLVAAGADELISGQSLTDAPNPALALETLRQAAK